MLDPTVPPCLHLVSAFLSMEPTDYLISLSKLCGGGSVTEGVQRFVWDSCISNTVAGDGHVRYLKNFVKKLILEIESNQGTVLDELYEQYGYYMSSFNDGSGNRDMRVCKRISFIFPDGCVYLPTCLQSNKLVIPLHCSLNMLEGDTGCSVWPSSLYLSEFILSFPEIFSNKSCFEVGSGVGLVGICLSYVKASKIILSDGDLSTLANLKVNLELNMPEISIMNQNVLAIAEMENESQVKCIHLPWESASERELQEFMPDIVLGADIVYDPSCLPHLVRLLAILLDQKKAKESCQSSSLGEKGIDIDLNGANGKVLHANELSGSDCNTNQNGHINDPCRVEELHGRSLNNGSRHGPVAYVASVIRNIDTFNYFRKLVEQANLAITDITEKLRPFDLLPYMKSYNRSSINLFAITRK